jgi:hypothetical protein
MVNEVRKAGVIKESAYPFGRDKDVILHHILQVVTYADGLEATGRYRDWWFFMFDEFWQNQGIVENIPQNKPIADKIPTFVIYKVS